MHGITALLMIMAVSLSAVADEAQERGEVFGDHRGYLFDVREERNRREVELVMLPEPKEPGKPLKDVIFNDRLTREFQNQYRYRFGQSQAEQVFNTSTRAGEYTYSTGRNVTILEHQKEQQRFGEYMMRRLTEYHVDNWIKNDKDLRPVYQAKERLSNINVEVRRGYKVKWKYNLAGPNMEVSVDNPYSVDMKVRYEMSGVISSPKETIYSLGYPITKKVSLAGVYREKDGLYQLVGTRRINSRLSTSLTGSTDTRASGSTVKQDLVLVGLSWSD